MHPVPISGLPSYKKISSVLDYNPKTGDIYWKDNIPKSLHLWMVSGKKAGSPTSNGYWQVSVFKTHFFAHRLAWFLFYKKWPKFNIDHINGNTLDNRIENLRDVPQQINNQNKRRAKINNPSGIMGATYRKDDGGTYESSIKAGGRYIYLGRFKDPQKAGAAYLKAKRQYHPGNTI